MPKGWMFLLLWPAIWQSPSAEMTLSRAWSMMGTLFVLELRHAEPALGAAAAKKAWQALDEVDQAMSSWKEDSEVRRLEPGRCSPVSTATAQVVTFALKVCQASSGNFDPTIAPLVAAWGFLRGKPGPPTERSLQDALRRVGCDRVRVQDDNCVQLGLGQELDLGGIAKGFALDRARERLLEEGVIWALLDLGGQLHHIGTGHPVVIPHPYDAEQLLAWFFVHDASVAVSAESQRFFEVQGKRYGHLLDPKTGQSVRGATLAAVVHPSAMVADALSTALYVQGAAALGWIRSQAPEATVFLLEEPFPEPGPPFWIVQGPLQQSLQRSADTGAKPWD